MCLLDVFFSPSKLYRSPYRPICVGELGGFPTFPNVGIRSWISTSVLYVTQICLECYGETWVGMSMVMHCSCFMAGVCLSFWSPMLGNYLSEARRRSRFK